MAEIIIIVPSRRAPVGAVKMQLSIGAKKITHYIRYNMYDIQPVRMYVIYVVYLRQERKQNVPRLRLFIYILFFSGKKKKKITNLRQHVISQSIINTH